MKCAAENQVKVGTAGGIEAIVKAINTHINNTKVCQIVCAILENTALNNSKTHIE